MAYQTLWVILCQSQKKNISDTIVDLVGYFVFFLFFFDSIPKKN